MWHDGVVKPHPPINRALQEMAGKLKAVAGVELVDWVPYKHDEGWDIISSLYYCDGGKEARGIVEAAGEPWLPSSRFILVDNPGVPHEEDTATSIWKKTCRRELYRSGYAAHWNRTGALDGHPVDVILCPVGPGAAPPLNHSRYWAYTWNLLDYPAFVFPYSRVDQEKDQAKNGEYVALNEQDAWNHKLYSPQKYVDAPISL